MTQSNTIFIIGCGGHSRSVTDVILQGTPDVDIVYVDDKAGINESIYGFKVLKKIPVNKAECFIAIGDNQRRKIKMMELSSHIIASVISVKAHIAIKAKLNRGCFVGNFCHLGPETSIGEGTILNTASVIEHEVQIGNFCHIGPNATISGRCKIGDLVFVGAGSVVKDYISICSNVTIGAGAIVVKDITEPGVYIGYPAKRFK